MAKFFLNPLAILFHPNLDKSNKYTTIVRNPQTKQILKINPLSYDILKIIDMHPGIALDEISQLIAKRHNLVEWENRQKINKFIQRMLNEYIILER